MRREWSTSLLLVAASSAVGVVGWNGCASALPTVLAFPALWSLAKTRKVAGLVSATYFLAASRGLPHAIATFYQTDIWPGLILWLAASGVFVMVHASLWSACSGAGRALRYIIVMLLMALPPFGILGWAHPMTAAGILFPDWGWIGLGAMGAGLAMMTTRYRLAAAQICIGFWLWSGLFAPSLDGRRNASTEWQAIDLRFGSSLGRDGSLVRHRELAAMLRDHHRPGVALMVLPENALGLLTPTLTRLWQRQLSGTGFSIVSGAVIVDPDGYDNVLVRISEDTSEILYRERMPVPGAMWQPWLAALGKSQGAKAHLFANPVISISGRRIAPLICYEQLIVWPILQSMLFDPDLVVAVGNGWWSSGTSIIPIQRMSTEAWARLFGKALVMSFSR